MADEIVATNKKTKESVSYTHPEYDENLDVWVKCRDVIKGSKAVKAKGTEYLPKLSGHTDDTYKDYKNRACYYPAVKRTIRGMAGMVFMKEPNVEGLPESLDYLKKDVTRKGVPLFGFAKQVFHEIMGLGGGGILVDMPKVGGEQKPYLTFYEREQIINWREERQPDGQMKTVLAVLSETYEEPDPADPFVIDSEEQFRVLRLEKVDEAGQPLDTPRYRHTIYRTETETEAGTGKQVTSYYIYDDVYPVRNGVYMDFIPFVPMGPEEVSWTVQQSPIEDMADVVLSHFINSADLENGRHWCGTPQPWMAGFPKQDSWQIGGDQIWQTTEPQAKAEMLEFTGQGLGALEKALEEKESKLAVLGMRILESQKKGAEQPETLRLRMLSDVSVLQSVVRTVSQGITTALNYAVAWITAKAVETTVTLNLDYDETVLSAQDLTALVSLWQSEGISRKTLYHNLEKGEITRPGVDYDQELKDIQEEKEDAEALNREMHPELYNPDGTLKVDNPGGDGGDNPPPNAGEGEEEEAAVTE